MTFKDSISTCLFKKYAVFNGRASRSEYWWFRLFKYLLLACCCLISMFMQKEQPALIFSVLLILFIPNLAVTRRRFNDCCMYKNNSWLLRIGMWLAMAVFIFFAVIADILTLIVPLDDPSQNAYEFFYPCLCAMSYEIPFGYMSLKTWNDCENIYGPSPFETEGNDSSYESAIMAKDSQTDSEKVMKEVRIYSDYSSFVWLLGWSAGLVAIIWFASEYELDAISYLVVIIVILAVFMSIIDHIKCIYLKIKNQPVIIFNEIGVHISTWTGYNVYEWYEIEEFEIEHRRPYRKSFTTESYLIITTRIGEEIEVRCDYLQRTDNFIYKTFKEQYIYYMQK